ncbi:MAG: aspartate kinase, partial [Bacilli bacterium]
TSRHIVVASAPGKRDSDDIKITDLLLALNTKRNDVKIKEAIISRFQEIISDLNIDKSISQEIENYFTNIDEYVSCSEIVSRGEYFCAKILAFHLQFKFIDAKDFLFFNSDGKIDFEESKKAFFKLYKDGDYAVVPGFYGRDEKGNIHLFSRGGSDITGAYIASFVEASLYENWTDVSGIFSVNPTIVHNPTKITSISYDEIRELSYMGANVIHSDSILPCQERNIPICILNTNKPEEKGTLISSYSSCQSAITGIAGKSGYLSLTLSKRDIHSDVNNLFKVLRILSEFNVQIESIASGIDCLTLTFLEKNIITKLNEITQKLSHRLETKVEIRNNLSLVSIVSRNKKDRYQIITKIFEILRNNQIKTRLVDHLNDDYSIIIGVDDNSLDTTISSLYNGLNNMRLI